MNPTRRANPPKRSYRVSLKSEVNRTRVETLLTDLELAATFAAIAETSSNEKRHRNLVNARLACFMIKNKMLPLCTLTNVERAGILRTLRQLEQRLRRLSEAPSQA